MCSLTACPQDLCPPLEFTGEEARCDKLRVRGTCQDKTERSQPLSICNIYYPSYILLAGIFTTNTARDVSSLEAAPILAMRKTTLGSGRFVWRHASPSKLTYRQYLFVSIVYLTFSMLGTELLARQKATPLRSLTRAPWPWRLSSPSFLLVINCKNGKWCLYAGFLMYVLSTVSFIVDQLWWWLAPILAGSSTISDVTAQTPTDSFETPGWSNIFLFSDKYFRVAQI